MWRRDVLVLAWLVGLVAANGPAASAAIADDHYPTRAVRLVIPSVPAGVHDVIGRLWAERVKPHLGAIVIDNRGGGGGLIGANDVAHAPPDGYSLLLGSTTTHVLLTAVMAHPPYHPVRDFSAVTVFAASSTSIVINQSLSARTLAELIEHAKTHPGKLSYGSAGNGSITHLAGELFKRRAGGPDIVHAPYKGNFQTAATLFGRPRPDAVSTDNSYLFNFFGGGVGFDSFPSSHAAIAAGLAGALSTIWPQHRRKYYALAIAVAASRFLTGAHYVGDALLGFAVGLCIVVAIEGTFGRILQIRSPTPGE